MAGSRCHAMIVCIVPVLVALGVAQADRYDDRVAELVHMQEKAIDGVIRMDDGLFRRFVAASDRPRPYALIIFFDAQQLRGQAELKLEEFRREFFYHGSGMQLGTEGFVVGFLDTTVAILSGFVTHVAPNIGSKNVQRILMVVAIVVSFVAVRKVIALDNWKTGYWIHAFWPTRWA